MSNYRILQAFWILVHVTGIAPEGRWTPTAASTHAVTKRKKRGMDSDNRIDAAFCRKEFRNTLVDYMLWMEKSSHTTMRWSGIDGSVSPLGNMLYTFATADALSSLSDVYYRFEGRV